MHLATLSRDQPIPTLSDLYVLKEAEATRSLMEDTPLDVQTITDDFKVFRAALPDLVECWKSHVTQLLLDILISVRPTQAGNTTKTDGSVLDLATSAFRCTRCEAYLSYPRVLVHSCLRDGSTTQFDTPTDYTGVKHTSADFAALSSVITAHGFDPDVATIQDLDGTDLVLACKRCSSDTHLCAMEWQVAPEHSDHGGWITLSAEDAAEVKHLAFERDYYPFGHLHRPRLACAHCRLDTSYQGMKYHAAISHEILNPVEGKDFVQGLDEPLFRNCLLNYPRRKFATLK
ncbi:hypothetical protein HGRIS_013730 [Hohenbuehelia grisea]|uniref:C2H2-type domain-containing protein n=1 Tax=Hohenbuehelia grisea TaxID=104357 RepID=A0ABR3IWJ5_9AGAR